MPISKFLADKWNSRLYNWLLWRNATNEGLSGDAKISSIYRPELCQGGYREPRVAVVSGEAMDTDALMMAMRNASTMQRIHDALVEWAFNDGTQGAQAKRLDTDRWSYADWVDTGVRWLEGRSRASAVQQIKNRRLLPQKG